MKKTICLIIVILIGFLFVPNNADASTDELEEILEGCAAYCKKLENSVLFFICKEKITEDIHKVRLRYPTAVRKTYLYDYQLIRRNNKIVENRDMLEQYGRPHFEKKAILWTRFIHKNIIMGPVGLLSAKAQTEYDYKIIKEQQFMKEDVYIIEATPKPGHITIHLYGKAWVRKNDFAALKIEWNQQGIEGYEKILEISKSLKGTPDFTMVSEYAFEKNGIRFPSKYQITEEYERKGPWTKLLISKKNVEYYDYKFFTVDTQIKY